MNFDNPIYNYIYNTNSEYYNAYNEINKNLCDLFNVEHLETFDSVLNDENELLCQFKKWFDFWNSKRVNLNLQNINQTNNLILIKNQICEEKIIKILKELDNLKLKEKFIQFIKK